MQNIIMKAIEGELLQDKKNDVFLNEDYVIFGNSRKYVNFVEDIKKYNLPYVPFKIMFAEGMVASDQDDGEPTILKMAPVWVSFSENNNIVLFCNFMSRGDSNRAWYSDKSVITNIEKINKDQQIYFSHPDHIDYIELFDGSPNNKILNDEISHDKIPNNESSSDQLSEYESSEEVSIDENYESSEETSFDDRFENNHPNILFCNDENNEFWIHKNVFVNLLGYKKNFENVDIVNFLTERYMDNFFINKYDNSESAGKNYDNYSIVNNKLVLRSQHFPKILNKIKEIKLYESIISKLNDITISSTQRSIINKAEHYCNEQVYGTFNLITIYGGLIC